MRDIFEVVNKVLLDADKVRPLEVIVELAFACGRFVDVDRPGGEPSSDNIEGLVLEPVRSRGGEEIKAGVRNVFSSMGASLIVVLNFTVVEVRQDVVHVLF